MKSIQLAVDFEIGDRVISKLDIKKAGLITGFYVRPIGVLYAVTWESNLEEKTHYAMELQSPEAGAAIALGFK